MKKALITGAAGQDGSYMVDLLLEKGYEVYALVRSTAGPRCENLFHSFLRIKTVTGDITDPFSMEKIIEDLKPDELYHFAAQSFVGSSWINPKWTFECNLGGTLNVLEAVRKNSPQTRVLNASSSEMFGRSPAPQNEKTSFHPVSPYGVSKVAAHHLAVNYRESYDLFVACSISFNHESPRRGEQFVTQKIIRAFAQAAVTGKEVELRLGNLDALRDWGHAKDYVQAMWQMLQMDKPDDFVLGSGVSFKVFDFLAMTKRLCKTKPGHVSPVTDSKFMRPVDDFELKADPSKALKELGWKPLYGLNELIVDMFEHECERFSGELRRSQK